jgi:predicted phosphoribosyltransferase
VRFPNRDEAGRLLGLHLKKLDLSDPVVLGLPRGGVPVARAVAQVLGIPMDVLLVRKLGVPWQPELAFGAIAEGGVQALDESLVRDAKLSAATIARIAEREAKELVRRAKAYRGSRTPAEVSGRTVIVVDDGLATGSTMLAAVRVLRQRAAARIVVAAPVGSRSASKLLKTEADDVVCLALPEPFNAVGDWYLDFHQMTDREVCDLLSGA